MFKQYRGLRKELYILFFGRIVTNLGSMIWPMLTLILNQKLNMSAEQVGNWFLLYSIVALPFTLLGGKITDKFNRKNVIVVCDLISVVGFIICSIIPLSMTSIILFGFSALFQNMEWSAYDALVADFSSPKDRGKAYSLMYLGANFGLILAPTIGGFLFNDYLNLAFLIDGLAIFSSTILIFFLVKNTNREYDKEDLNEYETDYKESTFSFIKGNRVMLLNILSCLLCNAFYNQWDVLLPIDLGAQYGANGSIIYGTLTSVNCITVVVATAGITALLMKVFDIDKFIIGQALEILGLFICITFIEYKLVLYLGIIVFTIGEIVLTISNGPFTSRRIPANHRGRYSSIVNVGCGLFTALSSKFIGAIYDASGSNTAWNVIYLIGVADILVIILMRYFDKKDYKNLYD